MSTFEDLITQARDQVADVVVPYKCSDRAFATFANEAQNEACRRARLLVDSSTTAICSLTLPANTPTVALDPRVVFIRRAKLTGRSLVLRRISYRQLDAEAPDWQSETGEPRGYVPDFDHLKFRPWPTPTEEETVTITVVRLPLADMADGGSPEIRSHYHAGLVHWMRYRYYLLPDPDVYDPKAAATALALFEAEFGPKSSALDEAWLERNADFLEGEGQF